MFVNFDCLRLILDECNDEMIFLALTTKNFYDIIKKYYNEELWSDFTTVFSHISDSRAISILELIIDKIPEEDKIPDDIVHCTHIETLDEGRPFYLRSNRNNLFLLFAYLNNFELVKWLHKNNYTDRTNSLFMPIVLHTGNFEMFKWGIDENYKFLGRLIPITKSWGAQEMVDHLIQNKHKIDKWSASIYKGAWERY